MIGIFDGTLNFSVALTTVLCLLTKRFTPSGQFAMHTPSTGELLGQNYKMLWAGGRRVDCAGIASHPGGIAILLVTSFDETVEGYAGYVGHSD